jgi:hypothetical protein
MYLQILLLRVKELACSLLKRRKKLFLLYFKGPIGTQGVAKEKTTNKKNEGSLHRVRLAKPFILVKLAPSNFTLALNVFERLDVLPLQTFCVI